MNLVRPFMLENPHAAAATSTTLRQIFALFVLDRVLLSHLLFFIAGGTETGIDSSSRDYEGNL
jgi:hypothetical protein